MFWVANCYKNVISLEGAVGLINIQYYTISLEEGLLSAVDDQMGDICTL